MSRFIITLTIFSIIGLSLSSICGDGSQCPGVTTCCEISIGGYGCCPFQDATCCDDGVHCCPNGYTCDVEVGSCLKTENSNEFLTFLDTNTSESSTLTAPLKVSTPSMADIIACITDIKPVVSDVITLVEDFKNGEKSAITAALLKLATDGYSLGEACYKVITDLA